MTTTMASFALATPLPVSSLRRTGVGSTAPTCYYGRINRPGRPFPRVQPSVQPRVNLKCGASYGAAGPFVWNWGCGPGGANYKSWVDMIKEVEKASGTFSEGGIRDAMKDMASALALPVDTEETDDAYTFTGDVPGLEKGDLKITVNAQERLLTVAGERRRPGADASEAADKSGREESRAGGSRWDASAQGSRRRRERRFGSFRRQFKLPESADLNAVSARVEKGVLTLTVRKLESAKPDIRDVEIS